SHVHFVLPSQGASLPARAACAALGLPATLVLQLSPRTIVPVSRLRRAMESHCGKTQRWVTVSEHTKRQLCRLLPLEAREAEVIHNGIDVRRFHGVDRAAARAEVRRALGLAEDARILL